MLQFFLWERSAFVIDCQANGCIRSNRFYFASNLFCWILKIDSCWVNQRFLNQKFGISAIQMKRWKNTVASTMWMARVPLSLQIGTICFLLPVEVSPCLEFCTTFFQGSQCLWVRFRCCCFFRRSGIPTSEFWQFLYAYRVPWRSFLDISAIWLFLKMEPSMFFLPMYEILCHTSLLTMADWYSTGISLINFANFWILSIGSNVPCFITQYKNPGRNSAPSIFLYCR